jgi:prevent-host-death family protein
MADTIISATEFKAKCLDILDRIGTRELESVTITKRGVPVAVLVHPPIESQRVHELHGFLRGSVVVPEGVDLTDPVIKEVFDAERGKLHR